MAKFKAKLRLEMNVDNAAFHEGGDSMQVEVARILRNLADKVEQGGNRFPLMDINGNVVGYADYKG